MKKFILYNACIEPIITFAHEKRQVKLAIYWTKTASFNTYIYQISQFNNKVLSYLNFTTKVYLSVLLLKRLKMIRFYAYKLLLLYIYMYRNLRNMQK